MFTLSLVLFFLFRFKSFAITIDKIKKLGLIYDIMKEIELKILEINPKEIEKKIISLGGKKTGSYFLKVKLYDFPDGSLKSNFSVLRIRTYENEKVKNKIEKTEFTFKQATDDLKNKSEFKICEELQTDVSDAKELQKIVEALGLVLIKDLEKKRASFELGKANNKVKIEIDEYPGVEGDEKTIPPVVKKLGYTMKDTTTIGGIQVLKKYGKNTEFLKFK
jgi:adenylate cyclase class 2